MSLAKCASSLCLILMLQHVYAETDETSESIDDDVDEEFLEVLGSIEADEDEWFDIFLSTIDEADEKYVTDTEYE